MFLMIGGMIASAAVHPSGYVRMDCPPETRALFSKRTLALVDHQLVHDDATTESLPKLHCEFETPLIQGTLRRIDFSSRLRTGTYETRFRVQQAPNFFVRYSVNCDDLGIIHPAYRDYWFSSALRSRELSDGEILFVSPAIKFHYLGHTAKIAFTFKSIEDMERCSAHPSSLVRYSLVRPAPRESQIDYLASLDSERFSLKMALGILKSGIQALRALHTMRVIHGNINPETVIVPNIRTGAVVFRDFRKTFFVEDSAHQTVSPFDIGKEGMVLDFFRSPFEIRTSRYTFKDDLFRMLMVGAYLIHKKCFLDLWMAVSLHPVSFIRRLQGDMIFSPPGCPKTAGMLEVEQALNRILAITKSIEEDSVPPYEDIIAQLDVILGSQH
jgi:hypothetical protein